MPEREKTDFKARRKMLDRRRELDKLLDKSSLAPDQLWITCPTHGRQARDPWKGHCVMCPG